MSFPIFFKILLASLLVVFWRVKDVDRNDQDTLVLLTKALSTFLHVKIFKPHVCIFFLPELSLIRIENMEKQHRGVC